MRLDKYLSENGFLSRTKAARAIENGLVTVNGKIAKASDEVTERDKISVQEQTISFVSEGGYKLYKALSDFGESVQGEIFADFGASTGGFTDCLLQNGAKLVYAVDVGESQLAASLQSDARVVRMDNTNVRYLEKENFHETLNGIAIDVSFISLLHVLPVASKLLSEGGRVFALIKPQFECGKKGLNKNGLVTDERVQLSVVGEIFDAAKLFDLHMQNITNAPIRPRKNIEYMTLFRKGTQNFCSKEEILLRAKSLT